MAIISENSEVFLYWIEKDWKEARNIENPSDKRKKENKRRKQKEKTFNPSTLEFIEIEIFVQWSTGL